MAPEAPADTAGPSSPPPRLPEGWLPQWEGVQRKWYYVQRTTGKSQWDIPTEPVVLTPSTTPTPIGPGPSPTPASHSTSESNRGLELGDTMAGGNYSAADSARISNSLNSQIYGQPEIPLNGSFGVPGWYSNQTGQHLPNGYEQQPAATGAGYGVNPLQQAAGQLNDAQSALYTSQTHPGYPITGLHHLGQSMPSATWGNNLGISQGHQSGFHTGQHAQPFQGFPAVPLLSHQQAPPWGMIRNPQGQMVGGIAGAFAPQPQWRPESQQGRFNASGEGARMNVQQSSLPKPFFGPYSSNQHTEPSSRDFACRASNTSLIREGQPYQSSLESIPGNPPHSTIDQGRLRQGYTNTSSHPQHSSNDPALQGFSPLQHVQSQYQQQHMIQTHSNSSTAQNHQEYHNPLAQAGANQYISQRSFGRGGGPAGYSETAAGHQMPYHQSSHYHEHSPGETGGGTESQFVSGPWTSTPPSVGQS